MGSYSYIVPFVIDEIYDDYEAPNSLNKLEEIFVDSASGNYNIKDIDKIREAIPDFRSISLEKIGRVNG